MAWIGTAELASAVSNAGGLGLIGAGHMPPDALRNEIHKAKGWTDKPFGVNVMLMSPFVKEVMQVILEERVPVITTGRGESRRVCAGTQGDRLKGHPRCGLGGSRAPSRAHGRRCRNR